MKVGLFVTCLVDLMRPSIGFASLRLLESAGCEVIVPATQTCCGQPAFNSGDRASAQKLASKTLLEFEACDYVVVPSGSCAGMMRVHYPQLFKPEHELARRAEALAARTFELTDFLVTVLGVSEVPGDFRGDITYHDCCSGLRELGVKAQPRKLLSSMAGVRLREMEECEGCCGFGGVFSIKFGAVAGHLAERKCRNVQATGAQAVVMGDLGCMLNVEGRLRRIGDERTRVLHVAEVLGCEDVE